MAIITTSIGTDARDYATVELWEADLDNAGVDSATDDAVGEMYNDSVFDEVVTWDGGGGIGLASATLSVASGERHDGTAGSGARFVMTTGGNAISLDGPAIPHTIEWLEVDVNGQTGPFAFRMAGNTPTKWNLYNNIAHGIDGADVNGIVLNNPASDVLNCLLYDIRDSGAGGEHSRGIFGPNTPPNKLNIMNVTIHNIVNDGGTGVAFGIDAKSVANWVLTNCISTDPGGTTSGSIKCYDEGTQSFNLASDTTASGTGALNSKAAADQFVSIVGGSEDLHLKPGADAIDAGTDLGTTPSGVEIDIDDRDRDAEGDIWDMGADELVVALVLAEADDIPWFMPVGDISE